MTATRIFEHSILFLRKIDQTRFNHFIYLVKCSLICSQEDCIFQHEGLNAVLKHFAHCQMST